MVDDDNVRFSRHLSPACLTQVEQQRLQSGTVLICGAGGLGSPVATYLSMVGVGSICVVDCDNVDLSNLNRQFMYSSQDIGLTKAIAAETFLTPRAAGDVRTVHQTIDSSDRTIGLIENADIVFDCLDNIRSRSALRDLAEAVDRPLVWGAVGGLDAYVGYGLSLSEMIQSDDDRMEISPKSLGAFGPACGMAGSLMSAVGVALLCGRLPLRSRMLHYWDGVRFVLERLVYDIPDGADV